MSFIEFNQVLFAEKIALKRIVEKKISLREAANQIKIGSPTLNRFELGRTLPDVISFYRVCKWLDCDMMIFFNK